MRRISRSTSSEEFEDEYENEQNKHNIQTRTDKCIKFLKIICLCGVVIMTLIISLSILMMLPKILNVLSSYDTNGNIVANEIKSFLSDSKNDINDIKDDVNDIKNDVDETNDEIHEIYEKSLVVMEKTMEFLNNAESVLINVNNTVTDVKNIIDKNN